MSNTDQYEVIHIPITEVYSDDDFNCRGIIISIDVTDLGIDIAKNGLQFPIAVQPAEDVGKELPDGKRYRIVAGHRRFKAWSILHAGWQPGEPGPAGVIVESNPYVTIPCMVKRNLSEVQARVLNLGENLKRRDLSILQEARAISHLHALGVPRDHVADELGMSSGWVQTRFNLLDLPEEVQQQADAGMINQKQIKELYSIRHNEEAVMAAVRKIREAKQKGEKIGHVGKRKKPPVTAKKERKRPEIFDMIKFLRDSVGMGMHTRCLSWAAGEITTLEVFDDIREFCAENNIDPPHFPDEM